MATAGFTVSSRLPATADAVWARVTTIEGVNHELMPLCRMRGPRAVRDLTPETVVLGERVARFWILALGVMPIDYDDLVLVELEPGRGFHERSTMLTQRVWEHRRTLEPDGDGCVVTDHIRFEPRGPLPGAALRPLYRLVFRHRHRRLRRWFSAAPGARPA